MADTFKGSTSGCGSSFEAWVHRYIDGDQNKVEMVEKRTGFRSRPEAQGWVRARIREAEGRPMKAKKPNGCRNCHWADKSEGGRRGPWRCSWPMPELDLPEAITKSITFKGVDFVRNRSKVWTTDGAGCPTWAEAKP